MAGIDYYHCAECNCKLFYIHSKADESGGGKVYCDKCHQLLLAQVKQLEKLPYTHHDPKDCPTWYDNCHCNVETLEHNIKRVDELNAELEALKGTSAQIQKK